MPGTSVGAQLVHKPVDLLFDARHIRQSGIGTYIETLLPHLEDTLAHRQLSLAILADHDTVPPVRDSTVVVLARPSGASMYSVAEQRAWSFALHTTQPRAFWVPHYPFPLALLRRRNRRILPFVTVHDTLHLQKRSISGQNWPRRMYARTMLNLDARMCRTIFTPSHATAASLVKAAPSACVTVTPIPVNDAWLAPADPNLSPVRGGYILYVGNTKHHKNVPLLVNAFARVAGAVPQDLVVAGGGQSVRTLDDRVAALAARHGDRVTVLGRIDFDALRSLIAGADLLVMPSLFEGAGLPPLEAMASGTAVLCSAIPVLRETCGDGADYFDPYDEQALAALLQKYCCDDDARAGLAARGWAWVTQRQSQISVSAAAEKVCAELDGSGP
ncbi:MAG: glycosyltransferase family 1 protein [Mycobacterium sp.]